MNNNDLMISVSGVRAIVGKSLTPELLVRLGHAFGTYMRSGRIVVGRDTRVSGDMARHAVLSGLIASGCEIIDAGVCATPTLTLLVEQQKAAGGVMITASHNPIEWNALKFFRADGMYLNTAESRDLLNVYYSGQFTMASWDGLKPVQRVDNGVEYHVDKVLSILDRDLIRSQNFRVALDCCNGAGCGIAELLLKELGCDVHKIHCVPNGLFPHKPEPLAANLTELCNFVRETGSDIGFATDPDADRVAGVDADGVYLGEEASLALSMQYALSRMDCSGRSVVINMSTSRMTEDVAIAAGCRLIRTPAGESNVTEEMKELNAIFGGEGNGGVIDPRIHYGRDSIIGIGLMLEAMARSGHSIRYLTDRLPQYHMVKTKIDCPASKGRAIIRRMKDALGGSRVDLRDGLRMDWEDRWVQVRASNTEPILRIIAEAKTKEDAQALVDQFTALAAGGISRRATTSTRATTPSAA